MWVSVSNKWILRINFEWNGVCIIKWNSFNDRLFEHLLSNDSFGRSVLSLTLARCSIFMFGLFFPFEMTRFYFSLPRNHFNILLLFELFFFFFAFHHHSGLRVASLSLWLASLTHTQSVNWDGIAIVRCLSYKRMEKNHHQLIELTWILISPWYAALFFFMMWGQILRSNRITIIEK